MTVHFTRSNISIKKEWNIFFKNKNNNQASLGPFIKTYYFEIDGFDKIQISKNINIFCDNSSNLELNLNSSVKYKNFDKHDEFLQYIKVNINISKLYFGKIDISDYNYDNYEIFWTDKLSNCKFIKNKFLCPKYLRLNLYINYKNIVEEYRIEGKPGTNTFKLKNLYK